MNPRIQPAARPYDADMETTLGKLMPPGVEPLLLFRTLAKNPRVFRRFMAGGLLDRGSIGLREREIVIARACARCRAEYEWGVHVAFFGGKVGFGPDEVAATAAPGVSACWSPREALLVELVDELHDTAAVGDALWSRLQEEFREDQLIELVVLAGLYHMVSFTVNALPLPPEDFGARFPSDA